MITVKFKGQDITNAISINQCIHDMYCEERSDTLIIRFNDTQNEWDSWQPKVGDEIFVEYGSINTGKMFVDSANPENGLYTIVATSIPPSAKAGKSKSWQRVTLQKIGQEIAKNHGLSFKAYGVEDILYEYILQTNETDFSFFQRLCTLEGCAFLVYDGIFVLYSQVYMENTGPLKTISITADSDYTYMDNSARLYGSCLIKKGVYIGTYNANNGSVIEYVPDMNVQISISNQAEANRYAKNILRNVNKNMITGYLYGRVLPEFSAASTMQLENYRAASWNGTVFITHIRNDYATGKSKIFFRKPLQGY